MTVTSEDFNRRSVRGRRTASHHHAEPSGPAERVHRQDDEEMIDAFDRSTPTTTCARSSSPARDAASAPAPTCRRRRARSTPTPGPQPACGIAAAQPRRRRAADAAHLRVPEAGDRRDQRAGGRRRRDDDAADGHPPRRRRRALRLRVRAPRHRAGGGVELVPAPRRRHQPRRWSGSHTGRVFPADEALERRPRAQRPAAGRAARRRARARARDRRQHVAGLGGAHRARCCGGCSAPTTRWRRTRSTRRAIDARGASADAREGVTAFLEKRPADVPDEASARDMPEFYPVVARSGEFD